MGHSLLTSHLANGHLWSLKPTNESYPLPVIKPLLPSALRSGFLHTRLKLSSQQLLVLFLIMVVVIDVYSVFPPPQTRHTDPPVYLQACKLLCTISARKIGEIHMPNLDSLTEDSLTLFLLSLYPIHSDSILCSYSTPLLFSSFNLSVFQPAHQYIRQCLGPTGLDHCEQGHCNVPSGLRMVGCFIKNLISHVRTDALWAKS